jgi:hypothetical protein
MSFVESENFVRDVIVQPTTPGIRVADEVFRAEPPIMTRIDLGHGLWVGALDRPTIDAVFDACRAPGQNFNPARSNYYHYCFCRDMDATPGASLNWDHDQRLRECLLLARLVHPTTVATCYSARLFYQNHEIAQIVPGPTQGLGAYAWVNGNHWRNWLTSSDMEEVKRLLTSYDSEKLPSRLRRAVRHFLYACYTYELDIRFTLVVTGLEALVNARNRSATLQFKRRLCMAGQDVGVTITEAAAKEAYDYRSNFVHGQLLQGDNISEKVQESYLPLETLLRLLIKRSIAEPQFASRFESESAIEGAYQV